MPACLVRMPPRDRALAHELVYGTLRWHPRLAALLHRLCQRKPDDPIVEALVLMGLYQLDQMAIPAHAAVHETVAAAQALRKSRAAGFINAALRRYQRERDVLVEAIEQEDAVQHAHPAWLLRTLQHDWPEHWEAICSANNRRPPLTLRINRRRISRAAYLEHLNTQEIEAAAGSFSDDAVVLIHSGRVENLPGYAAGWFAVQDAGAQLVALLAELKPGQRVLDACAAPGGKTGHLLECEPGLSALIALDCEAPRVARRNKNLARLGHSVQVVMGDAAHSTGWWDGVPFERILLDVPCSGTGVIRRHPDIKLLRRADDIAALAMRQEHLLTAIWPLLAPGGMLVYVTCSVLAQENEAVLLRFLSTHDDACEYPILSPWGHIRAVGRQILPGEHGMDGFYYARLIKRAAA